ncbi:hypothetical protein BJY01DRAFT_229563 [Aspergillus pseudoustus]|uniref:CBM-cenC domain-containing protein n=1 Tax=Aspergillus pseudoustus TaxID=1810923 RepID=A0ABR4IG76_9EURO
MSCILTQDPGFEANSGAWYPGDTTIGYVATNPQVAYAGNNYYDLAVSAAANEGTVSQRLSGLDTTTSHNLTLYVRIQEPIPSLTTCFVSAHVESNPDEDITSDLFSDAGQWLRLTGIFTPTQADDVLTIVGSCAFHDDYTFNHVLLDEVVLSDCDTQ